jgi:hypothetical protein
MPAGGASMDRSPDATDQPVLDAVSVLQTRPGVKRKARGDDRAEIRGKKMGPLTVGTRIVQIGGYWTRPARPPVNSRLAKPTKSERLRMLWRLYLYDTLLEGLAQDLQDVAAALRQLLHKVHAVVRPRHLAGQRHPAPPIRPTSEIVWCGARQGRVVTNAVRSPVRPATRGMRVVSRLWPGASPAGWWPAGATASTSPRRASPRGGDHYQNA